MSWTHKFTDTKSSDYAPGAKIKVEAGLHKLSVNRLPYFSVTGKVYIPGRRDCEMAGCIHADILKSWPELAPVITLHLSDSTGQPMHAEANGWYQLTGYYGGAEERYHAGNYKEYRGGEYRLPTPDECLQQFADHVRIPLEDARTLAENWRNEDDSASSRRWFGTWVTAQAERWQAEADAACRLLDTLIAQKV